MEAKLFLAKFFALFIMPVVVLTVVLSAATTVLLVATPTEEGCGQFSLNFTPTELTLVRDVLQQGDVRIGSVRFFTTQPKKIIMTDSEHRLVFTGLLTYNDSTTVLDIHNCHANDTKVLGELVAKISMAQGSGVIWTAQDSATVLRNEYNKDVWVVSQPSGTMRKRPPPPPPSHPPPFGKPPLQRKVAEVEVDKKMVFSIYTMRIINSTALDWRIYPMFSAMMLHKTSLVV